MYTVSKGPSKIVAKTRRGLTQNYETFETIKESSKRSAELNSPEKNNMPRPVFQTNKKALSHTKVAEEEIITPQHEEIIKYINDSWNIIVAQNPYDTTCLTNGNKISLEEPMDTNNNTATFATPILNSSAVALAPSSCGFTSSTASISTSPINTAQLSSIYCIEPPNPVLSDFKPFDLESWWGRRLFNNITKSL